jgi:transposase
MAITLPDSRQLSDETLDAFRLRALRGLELGYTETQLAELLGVARETVSRWCSAYTAGGLDALPGERTGRPVGSGRMLSDEQAQRIQQILDTTMPDEMNIPAPLWNRRAVRDLIQKECGISLAVRTVGTYLARWGYTSKKPQRHARDQDPEEVQEWLEKTYPALEKQAELEDAEIFFCDETGAVADAFSGTGYAKKGEPAKVDVPHPHIHMNTISAVSNSGSVHFMTYAQTMTAALFVVFLDRLLRSTVGKIILIVDRLPAHRAEEVEAWVARHSDRLELVYLPCGVPELNVDEYLNNDLKSQINEEGLPHNPSELRSRIQEFLRKLIHFPDHVRSYFQAPFAQYAAGNGT